MIPPVLRIAHVQESIRSIRALVTTRSREELERDSVARAALERFFEVLSEASRHIPADWKAKYPDVPWRNIAGLGNVIRHAYDQVDLDVLWDVQLTHLMRLESALDDMLRNAPREGPA